MTIEGTHARTVTFATFNFDCLDGEKSVQSKQALAKTIARADADVVACQEIESEQRLDEFAHDYLPADSYPYRAVFTTPGSSQNVAIMSRFPLRDTESISGPFTRNVGSAEIGIPGYPMRAYVVHLKADPQPGDAATWKLKRARKRRQDELFALHSRLLGETSQVPHRRYVVLGDFNTTRRSAEMGYLLATGDVVDPLAAQQGRDEPSHLPTGRRFDQTYPSPELAPTVASVTVLPPDADARTASDHVPVVMTLDLDRLPQI